jgi:FMN phosphatase YigB (HAD superfamily)
MSERGARIKAVIFDSGGTLVHDRGFSRIMCGKISEALKVLAGLGTSPDQIEKLRECSERQREDVEL